MPLTTFEQSLDGNAWNEEYETQIKAFYEKEALDNYDARALSNSLVNITSAFRNEREQHNAKEWPGYKKQTEDGQIKNYSGMFIESEMDKTSLENLFSSIKNETHFND